MVRSINKAGLVLMLVIFSLMLANCGGGGGGGTAGGGTLPAKPTGLTAAVSSNLVTLTWNASANATGYQIYRSSSSGLSKSTVSPTATTTSTIYNDLAANGNTYYYVVTALNGVYESASSAEVSARLTPPVASPTFVATSGDASVTLIWTNTPNAASYSVYRSTSSGTLYSAVVTSIIPTLFTDTTVTNNTNYYYIVKGANAFGEGAASLEAAARPGAPGGTITVGGVIRYEDKEYNQTVGQTGATSFKPVRYAEVQLIDANTSATLVTTFTTSSGFFFVSSASIKDKTVYVRVLSSAMPILSERVNIKNLNSAIYAVKTENVTLSGDTSLNLSIPVTNPADGAFNILDVLTSGFEFVNAYAGTSPPTLNAFWQQNSQYGTYFCPGYDATWCRGGEGIYVLGDPFVYMDTDEFDDDVLWHEFGHFALDKFSFDDSPGGNHWLNDNTQDLRLSWSEGWGNFFQGATKYWIDSFDPGRLSDIFDTTDAYVDTEVGGIYIALNIANPDASTYSSACAGGCFKYSSNEISVANVLWQLMAEPAIGMLEVWKSVAAITSADQPVSIETFWDKWLFVNAPSSAELATLNAIYSTRSITYQQDAFEGDDTIATASTYTPGSPQTHTLYGSGDADFVQFVPSSTALHTISTSSLRNGADTLMTLYDSGSVTVKTSDDYYAHSTYPPNDDLSLSSKIQYLLTSGQTYYISVKSSPTRPVSAGKYGSYTLTISP